MTLQEAERITAVYRRWFSEAGDTDLKLVRRCQAHLMGAVYALFTMMFLTTVRIYQRSVVAAIICVAGCNALAIFFGLCAWRLGRVRELIETYGLQNLSEISHPLPNDRNS